MFWPEATEDSARTVLRQTLYSLRRDLGAPDLIVGSTELRLNRTVVTSDSIEFEQAVQRADWEECASLYAGPFLDGFHLSEAAEFERWQEAERARYHARATAAIERLAALTDTAGDNPRSIRWWNRLTELDPSSSSAMLGLVKALIDGGNPALAIHRARKHEALLQQEFGSGLPAELAAILSRLQMSATPARKAEATPRRGPDVLLAEEPAVADDAIDRRLTSLVEPAAGPRPAWRRPMLIGAAVTLMGAILVSMSLVRLDRAEFPDLGQAEVVVMPFRLSATDSSSNYLHEGIVDLLAARLNGANEMVVMDPRATLRAWHDPSVSSELDEARRGRAVAVRLGAARAVTGAIVATPGQLEISATLTSLANRSPIAEARVDGPADSALALVDRLAAALMAIEQGESPERVPSITASPLQATRAYLAGQAEYRRGHYDAAANHFRSALQIDSMFALAGFRLALASGLAGRAQAEHDWGLARAWAGRERLIPRDRAFLIAFGTGRLAELRASGAEVYARWERAVSAVPDWPEVWYEYGDALFHDGRGLEQVAAQRRAASALRRALAIDSMFAPAIPHLLQLEAQFGNTDAVRRLGTRYLQADSTGGAAEYVRWRIAHSVGDSSTVRSMRGRLSALPRTTLRWIIQAAHFDGVANEVAPSAAMALIALGGSAEERYDAYRFAHDAALNGGRAEDVSRALDGIASVRPATQEANRWRVLDALYANGDRAEAMVAAGALARTADASLAQVADDRVQQYKDMCVLAQWRLARGDHKAAARAEARLRLADNSAGLLPEWSRGESLVCADLLQVLIAAVVRPGSLPAKLASLDTTILSWSPGEGLFYFPIARGRAFAAAGDTAMALRAVRQRFYFAFNAPYLSIHLRDEGLYAASTGDTTGAIRAWTHYLTLRSSEAPARDDEVSMVRSRLAALLATVN